MALFPKVKKDRTPGPGRLYEPSSGCSRCCICGSVPLNGSATALAPLQGHLYSFALGTWPGFLVLQPLTAVALGT